MTGTKNLPTRPPLKLEVLHAFSSQHRDLLHREEIQWAGCYYCLEYFLTSEIVEWIDFGQTAFCPRCRIDAVLPELILAIGEGSSFKTTDREVLKEMNEYWFGETSLLADLEDVN